MKVPEDNRPFTVRVDTPELPPRTVAQEVGANETDGPAGITIAVRQTFPEKLLMLLRVIVVVLEEPTRTLSGFGFAAKLKSTTFTVKTVEAETEPLVPFTVIV